MRKDLMVIKMSNVLNNEKEWIDEVWEKLNKKLSRTAVKCRETIPYTSVNGSYDDKVKTDICWWTNGFWPGLMWLMYVGTKNEEYKKTAERAEELLDEAFVEFDGLHHDVGFMWLLSSGVNYRLTHNKKSRIRTAYAANLLAGRYNPRGKFIRAWNDDDDISKAHDGGKGVAIIDCMLNIQLLFLASEMFDDPRYKYIAMSHADTTMANHVRPDGSV
ncbi:MAG: glycosyl hydrolase family 88, partial [Candidatus Ornithomonoglobus sp.]